MRPSDNDFDVDFVIPWVDGSDPAWLAEKRKYCTDFIDDGNSANRYHDWGLLPYWFRAVEKFTPWVRKIHFVTWGHIPSFLNIDHQKIHIVRHEDYIPHEYLPTFSSHTIELNIHRIQGLSEHFIYFNDDIFPMHPCKKNIFFSKKGYPNLYFSEIPCCFNGSFQKWDYILANNIEIINKYFNKIRCECKNIFHFYNIKYHIFDNIRSLFMLISSSNYFSMFKYYHSANPFLKTTFDELWNKENIILNKTCHHKFRHIEDVNQLLPLWWQMVNGCFNPYCSKVKYYEDITKNDVSICNDILHMRCDLLCINDIENIYDDHFNSSLNNIKKSFHEILPEKCSFEM